MYQRIIASLSDQEADDAHLMSKCHRIFLESLHGLKRDKYAHSHHGPSANQKQTNLIIFSGEGSFVDSHSLIAQKRGFDALKMLNLTKTIKNGNKEELRYLIMYYEHTLSLFRPGIISLLSRLNDIGYITNHRFHILFYCQPHQFQKFSMYNIAIQMYYEQKHPQNEMEYVSFSGVISSESKSLEEASRVIHGIGAFWRPYRRILVVDSLPFHTSMRKGVAVVHPKVFKMPLKSGRDCWMNRIQKIHKYLQNDSEIKRLQQKCEYLFLNKK